MSFFLSCILQAPLLALVCDLFKVFLFSVNYLFWFCLFFRFPPFFPLSFSAALAILLYNCAISFTLMSAFSFLISPSAVMSPYSVVDLAEVVLFAVLETLVVVCLSPSFLARFQQKRRRSQKREKTKLFPLRRKGDVKVRRIVDGDAEALDDRIRIVFAPLRLSYPSLPFFDRLTLKVKSGSGKRRGRGRVETARRTLNHALRRSGKGSSRSAEVFRLRWQAFDRDRKIARSLTLKKRVVHKRTKKGRGGGEQNTERERIRKGTEQ